MFQRYDPTLRRNNQYIDQDSTDRYKIFSLKQTITKK